MKKVTLYNPKSGELRDYRGVPVSLLAVSRILYNEGYEIKILQHFDDDLDKRIIEECKNSVCLGITCMTGHQIKDGLNIAKKIRKIYPKLPLIWGGWHPSILPEQTLKSKYVDIIIRGQGEITFTELVHALENKTPLENIAGIGFKKGKKMILNPERNFEDINKFPELPYHLIDVKNHLLNSEFGKRTINYYASQGCPFRCAFCADPQVYKRRWSGLNPDRIISELQNLKEKYEIDSVILADSNFFINEKHTKEFCEKAIKAKLNLKFGQINGRSNVLARYSEETWKLMKKAGFVNILNGTESGSQDILNFVNKDATIADTIKLAKLCKKYDITLVCSTFIGLPTKNIDEEFDINVNLINELMEISNKNTYYLLIYAPYPGSPMYDLSVKEGFIPPDSFEKWANFELHKINTPWVSQKYVNLGEQFSLYYFPFLGNQLKQIINHHSPILQILFLPVYYLFRTILKIRWKLKFFSLPIDYHIFRSIIYLKDKLSRKI